MRGTAVTERLSSTPPAHDHTAHQWLPLVYDIAGPLLETARLNEQPPTLVRQTQEAISWLSRAPLEIDQDSAEAPTALADALARLLTVWVVRRCSSCSP